jgi:signal peptidase I
MSPTLKAGTLITVDTLFDRRKGPNRWDVVVTGAPQVEVLDQDLGVKRLDVSTTRGNKSAVPQLKRLTAVVNAAADAFEKGSAPARPHMFFVNRVVGLPGERIQFKDSKILINGRALRIPAKLAKGYAALSRTENLAFGAEEYRVPKDSVFVLNDNPAGTTDSRQIGAISIEFLVGRVKI